MNELVKIRAFNQQPTIDSITQGLNEKGVLIRGEDRLMTRLRIGGDRVYGWMIKWAAPVKDGASSPTEDGKTNNAGSVVPIVPASPPKKNENISEKNLEQFGDRQKKLNENTGDSGDREREKREIDSDYGSKVSVPCGVLSGKVAGDSSGNCGIGSHPRKDEPTPAKAHSDRIRAAAISEYGLSGWVDPRKIANALKLQLGEVEVWLQANYAPFERPGGGIGYKQRRAGEAKA
jgi:hypothetical protein